MPQDQMEFDFGAPGPGSDESPAAMDFPQAPACRQPMLDLSAASVSPDDPDAIAEWRRELEEKLNGIAAELGLPLGRKVRLELRNGSGSTGTLELDPAARDAALHRSNEVPLRLGILRFSWRDVVSCVRE